MYELSICTWSTVNEPASTFLVVVISDSISIVPNPDTREPATTLPIVVIRPLPSLTPNLLLAFVLSVSV